MPIHRLNTELFAQKHRFIVWLPVWLSVGISIYFSLRSEPTYEFISYGVLVFVTASYGFFWRGIGSTRVLCSVPLLVVVGFCLAVTRAHSVSSPKLEWNYFGPIEGTVVYLDRSSSDKPRITLSDPVLSKMEPIKTPKKIRVSLHSDLEGTEIVPGARILVTARLSPPSGPVEPNGFDFQRKAWFEGLGAIGYARAPPVRSAQSSRHTIALFVFTFRMKVSNFIQSEISGQTGAFASAIITGDRSQIDPKLLENLRDSNLAHLLAISGLHMGLLTGFVFAICRIGISCVPYLSVRWNSKKIAAITALFVGLLYLVVSGGNIATQRAFVMVAVMLVSILVDRPAITLRAVAIAATLILVFRPESLISPGFQMSFAATTALVATFEALNKSKIWKSLNSGGLRFLSPFFSLFIASAVAGIATAPFSAFHFNQMAQFGLIANLLSVPIMGAIVMPAAVVAFVLTVVGLQSLAFWVMSRGIQWILSVAEWISELENATVNIPTAPTGYLGAMTFGALILLLYKGNFRFTGLVVIFGACFGWSQHERPSILVSDTGRLVGILTEQGRILNRSKGNGFAARSWLENDGNGLDQLSAAQKFDLDENYWDWKLSNVLISYRWGKKISHNTLESDCNDSDVLIAPLVKKNISGSCVVISNKTLKANGSVLIERTKGVLTVRTARDFSGERLWNK